MPKRRPAPPPQRPQSNVHLLRPSTLEPPPGLSPAALTLWRDINLRYRLEEHHRQTLRVACEALSLSDQATEQLLDEGLTDRDEDGVRRRHPGCVAAVQFRNLFLSAMKALQLDTEQRERRPVGRPSGKGA